MAEDLEERLRRGVSGCSYECGELRDEAADELSRLRSEVAALVEALEPFALCADEVKDIARARRLICAVKGIQPATEPCAKVTVQTHG